jgi:hypothetical protein
MSALLGASGSDVWAHRGAAESTVSRTGVKAMLMNTRHFSGQELGGVNIKWAKRAFLLQFDDSLMLWGSDTKSELRLGPLFRLDWVLDLDIRSFFDTLSIYCFEQ